MRGHAAVTRTQFWRRKYTRRFSHRVDESELAILSMGDLTPRSLFDPAWPAARCCRPDELRRTGAVGDVLGQFIDAKGRPINYAINKRAIALPLARLSKVKSVMLVAGGMNKVPVITAALRSRIGNILISDEKAAGAAIEAAEHKS